MPQETQVLRRMYGYVFVSVSWVLGASLFDVFVVILEGLGAPWSHLGFQAQVLVKKGFALWQTPHPKWRPVGAFLGHFFDAVFQWPSASNNLWIWVQSSRISGVIVKTFLKRSICEMWWNSLAIFCDLRGAKKGPKHRWKTGSRTMFSN